MSRHSELYWTINSRLIIGVSLTCPPRCRTGPIVHSRIGAVRTPPPPPPLVICENEKLLLQRAASPWNRNDRTLRPPALSKCSDPTLPTLVNDSRGVSNYPKSSLDRWSWFAIYFFFILFHDFALLVAWEIRSFSDIYTHNSNQDQNDTSRSVFVLQRK